MDITIDRIVSELKKQKKKQAHLAAFIGVTGNVITDWKSGRIKSYTKYIHGIAEFLGVSVEYLKGETDQKEKPTADDELSEDKQALIEFAKSVPEEKVDYILRVMKSILEND